MILLRKRTKFLVSTACLAFLTFANGASADSDFVATFTFPGGTIFGYLPVPQVNGFDYYFMPVIIDTAILGAGVTIESVEVSAAGQNNGAVVNFD